MTKTAAGLVIFRKHLNAIQYLLLQTSYGEHHWTPPKGHVDPGETDPMVTALRETSEESGLRQSDLRIFHDSKHILNYNVRGKPKIVIYWLAELINPSAGVRLSDEHQDFKWLELEEACRFGNYTDMQVMLKHYDNFIKTM
ncbi:hypothetical protein PPYR_15593 [Photinus pyralis]|uniref:Bis(5'-nucleosyl)-tetraphosphatase [asymmetrical] n=1 Tax=Photinus pyralis TaxID=7054 RepID=A0A1Y1NIU1_PHOPY|nr:bis(5'-nucleosyl)-tetraphosphatase [asymmetrical]-like [Photinus pyralis]KAB0790092.1 hypothetical protein PPYR_15593 [Photinus pyralis]